MEQRCKEIPRLLLVYCYRKKNEAKAGFLCSSWMCVKGLKHLHVRVQREARGLMQEKKLRSETPAVSVVGKLSIHHIVPEVDFSFFLSASFFL